MPIIRITKKAAAICLSISMAAFTLPAAADDLDILGQFLEQNFSTQSDPLGAFAAMNIEEQIEAQAAVAGPLLSSQSALIINDKTGEVLYQKNPNRVMPIASISKLMTAMVVLDANQNMNEAITITPDEIDRLKGTGSRLSIGTTLTRGELLHLSLMSSENRATHALGRSYPGGISAFVSAMNRKAQSLGMSSTRFYEPTGLDFRNVSTANDLSKMVQAASKYAVIRRNSTSNYGSVYTNNGRRQSYKNSNALVREGNWNIELQKTGYIREAGRSMVVKANVQNQPITIVLLNAPSSLSRVNDARQIESWMLQRRS
ncbi:D-alanyl-D-alanine carboxypeptidase [Neisseria animaloris]|uniref:D-alanyl-D-alanine carboxypeptidase n=2 Tax=Neisseria animaloris TaxID=326522 RepID=A0A1X3CN27_9NEIS|nr:serine hydrolase [Neisseria animaloris]MDO5073839.1 serine hydrolase [Neisseria animaloris]OSI09025.1 D-alanyl-D-alanine endopeptidase [Neisseria animaloris]VEH87166.1 D-alanyl-D-alanine carboxypeptidase [Neisseria animaloris]VEJ20694.1 D-alanyl-D-alanine carboxypeptidase [Neisseria animaloris]